MTITPISLTGISPMAKKTTEPHAHMRLWQLISQTLPVGAYAYSQGMDTAVDSDWITDKDSTLEWILGLLRYNLATLDIPIFARCYKAWQTDDNAAQLYWCRFLMACRGSAEFRSEDRQLGMSLARLLASLDIEQAQSWQTSEQVNFVSMFALASVHWHIAITDAAQGYLWTWCENQITAAIKLVPLGQTAGQWMLTQCMPHISAAVESGLSMEDDEIGTGTPGSWHPGDDIPLTYPDVHRWC